MLFVLCVEHCCGARASLETKQMEYEWEGLLLITFPLKEELNCNRIPCGCLTWCFNKGMFWLFGLYFVLDIVAEQGKGKPCNYANGI